jgi:dTDP-4-dehydrorhamnose reductase
MQNIIILGKNGQVGQALQDVLSSKVNLHAFDSKEADLTDERKLRQLIQDIKPQVIINAAAYTAVDRAETEEVMAFKVNARGPQIIGEEATTIGAAVIHFSSDYVFDGRKNGAYVETDRTNPLSVYAASKLEGEKLLLQACARSVILRTSWVVSHHGGNFLKTMLKLAKDRDVLRIVSDQHGVPTSAHLLAETSHMLIEKLSADPEHFPYGIYHLAPTGETTWFDYAKFVIGDAMKRGDTFKLSLDNIQAIKTEEYPLPAKRPQNSRLNTSHFRTTFGVILPSWESGILAIMDELYKG